jgi:enoyl-[acyl-carrier-protein] reductase (NADH)
VLLSRKPESYEPLVQEINSKGGQAVGISTDVSDANSVNAAFDQIEKQFPNSVLAATIVNTGGGFVRKPFLELTEDDYSSALKSQGCVLSNISSPGLHFRAFEI